MYYIVQLKEEETVVRNIFRNESDAHNKCDELSERWPHAYFDVFSEKEMTEESEITKVTC